MGWLNCIWDNLMKNRPTSTVVSVCSIVVLGCLALQSQFFILQLLEDTDKQAKRFLSHLSSIMVKGSLNRSFLPQEFLQLEPDEDGVYKYSAGKSCFHFLYRQSKDLEGLWECSDDGTNWMTTEALLNGDYDVFEPPTLFFITRLHFEYVLRNGAAAVTKPHFPPPLDGGRSVRPLDAAPDCLCCPISQQLMMNPVVLPSGKTFDKPYIQQWLSSHGRDPTTGASLAEDELYPNLALREIIERWMAQKDVDGSSPGAVELS